ncbi:MAG: riboflavin synthase [Balneola sp.]|jgi:riboflavin synthase|nr:riboflavin synthase [Balneola sp.]MBE77915.1 riboflavin synthase [Balneola sp.]HBX66815.1 riboflavin synthase [Balneolaceae bacterium]|tara:strand:+ start:523 stop:1128 length:606 start_codon:yes stop_codon:yes gene_type:complete
MFTGIVQEVGTVAEIKSLNGGGKELIISCSFAGTCHEDESIAVNGVCLTVTAFDEKTFTVQAVEETLRKTSTGELESGSPVNLERSLTLQKGIEGHLVQGHVDTTGKIKHIEKEETGWLLTIEYPDEYTNMIVGRGSITMEGISLTVARESENNFTVAIIPYTWNHTNLKEKSAGDSVNLEFDVIGKYVVKYLANIGRDSL